MGGGFIKDALFPRFARGSLPCILQDGGGPRESAQPSPATGRRLEAGAASSRAGEGGERGRDAGRKGRERRRG